MVYDRVSCVHPEKDTVANLCKYNKNKASIQKTHSDSKHRVQLLVTEQQLKKSDNSVNDT